MSDYILIPVSDTEAARVQCPLDLPLSKRLAFLAALPPDVLADAERVSLPGAPAPVVSPIPTEDAS